MVVYGVVAALLFPKSIAFPGEIPFEFIDLSKKPILFLFLVYEEIGPVCFA